MKGSSLEPRTARSENDCSPSSDAGTEGKKQCSFPLSFLLGNYNLINPATVASIAASAHPPIVARNVALSGVAA